MTQFSFVLLFSPEVKIDYVPRQGTANPFPLQIADVITQVCC